MSSLIRGLTDAPSKPGRSWHGGWALGFLERISVTGALLDRSLLTPTRPPYHASLLPTATPLHVLVPLPGAPPLPAVVRVRHPGDPSVAARALLQSQPRELWLPLSPPACDWRVLPLRLFLTVDWCLSVSVSLLRGGPPNCCRAPGVRSAWHRGVSSKLCGMRFLKGSRARRPACLSRQACYLPTPPSNQNTHRPSEATRPARDDG